MYLFELKCNDKESMRERIVTVNVSENTTDLSERDIYVNAMAQAYDFCARTNAEFGSLEFIGC